MNSVTPKPKRVILLFKSEEPNSGIIKAFLRYSGQSENEYEQNCHYTHLDPDRHITKWSHIVLDMNASTNETVDLKIVPHEIYKIKTEEDRL